jgi:orotate phosphoribosyltransferase
VRAIFAEREEGSMRLRRGFQIRKDERLLVVDDVITRGGSVGELIELVRSREGVPVGIAVVVDRSGGDLRWEVPLKSLIQLEMITHRPQECPLCRADIPLIKPGSRAR